MLSTGNHAGKAPDTDREKSPGLLISFFLDSCETKGLTKSTLKYYREKLQVYNSFLNGRQITGEEIAGFTRYLSKTNNPQAANCYLRAIKVFIRWAADQGLHPLLKVPMVKGRPVPPTPLNLKNAQRLLDAARKGPLGDRNEAIILTMLDTGCRPSELCNLKMPDVSFDRCTLLLDGKTGTRSVPFGPSVKKSLLAYLRPRPFLNERSPLFQTQNGLAMTPTTLVVLFRRLRQSAGIKERCFPYLTRHSAGTSMLQNGADLETVRKLLGHASITTTQNYLHLNVGDVARVQRRTSMVNVLR